jgi:hypothetical protein
MKIPFKVNEGLWYELCMNAHCAEETSEAKRAVVCDVTEAYARLCADKNVTIYWRSLLDCRNIIFSMIYTALFYLKTIVMDIFK